MNLGFNFAKKLVELSQQWSLNKMTHISSIDLSKNQLRDAGVIELSKCIKFIPMLSKLDLSSNEITPKGLSKLCKEFHYSQHMTFINLSTYDGVYRNRVGIQGGKSFAEIMGTEGNLL